MGKSLFVELLQVSLGTRDGLSRVPSAVEWQGLIDEAQRQAVAGILACGIERLPKEQQPPQTILLQWIGLTLQIEQRNKLTKRNMRFLSSYPGEVIWEPVVRVQHFAWKHLWLRIHG